MTEHENNLRDLFAGFALIGLLMKGEKPHLATAKSFVIADDMLTSRNASQGGIVSVKPKEKVNETQVED